MHRGRKTTGGKYHKQKKRKLYEIQNQDRPVILANETKRKILRVRGGNLKPVLLRTNTANILVSGKVKKAEIKNVEETPQNRFLARQNRLLKGAIIDTSLGKARISNRPSQEGQVNAILLEEKKH